MNPYAIIIILFAASGLVLFIWSWRKIQKLKQQVTWPKCDGSIIQSELTKSLVPQVVYLYKINNDEHKKEIDFPSEASSSPDIAKKLIADYPLHKSVEVSYNPDSPEISTLEPGPSREDWVGLVFGVGALVFSVFLLIVMS